jgi:ABC-type Zn uptake system ZnuABC Zn-binding protein ZnuA
LMAFVFLAAHGAARASSAGSSPSSLKVTAVETFLADIGQNVAGSRLKIKCLLPIGADPHSFEPTPGDVTAVAGSDVVIVNGGGFEGFLSTLLRNAGGTHRIIDASAGLASRKTGEGEPVDTDDDDHVEETGPETGHHHHHEGDPHFWLDPVLVLTYVKNIQSGLSEADPAGAKVYAANADAYAARLKDLDRWIADRIDRIPPGRRLLVTNHESFGYFADRYGFKIVGTVIPSVSADATPSARQLAGLVDTIRGTGAKAIFLETGTNPQLARQVAGEAGVKAVTELHTHSTTGPEGPAPSYIDMMKYNATAIAEALE